MINTPKYPQEMMPNGMLASDMRHAYELGHEAGKREAVREPGPRRASEFLERALRSLRDNAKLRDRQDGERSARKAKEILEAWTSRAWCEADIWRVLLAVKMARESQGLFHADDLVDLAGYAALLGESRAGDEVKMEDDNCEYLRQDNA